MRSTVKVLFILHLVTFADFLPSFSILSPAVFLMLKQLKPSRPICKCSILLAQMKHAITMNKITEFSRFSNFFGYLNVKMSHFISLSGQV